MHVAHLKQYVASVSMKWLGIVIQTGMTIFERPNCDNPKNIRLYRLGAMK